MVENFTTINRYFDNKYYPRGFSRHDDFTIREARLLEHRGCAFDELDLGRREPVTEEEKLFVAIYRGKHGPVTETGRMWSKYMTRIKRPKRFRTLSGGEPQVEDAEDYTDSND